jgi:hypothetical protein
VNEPGTSTGASYRRFMENGGLVVSLGGGSMASALGLPLYNHLAQRTPSGGEQALSGDQYYVPGSVLNVAVDTTSIAMAGLPSNHVDIFFSNNSVWRLGPDLGMTGAKPIMWFDTPTPLRSGWAFGQHYLQGGTIGIEATVGRGKAFIFTPDLTFRSTPHQSFKLVFNGIYAH